MSCLSLSWVEQLCVWLVIIIAIVAIIRLLVPLLVGILPGGSIVARIVSIILWAAVAIFVIYIVFGLLSCLLSAGHFHPLR